jgi:Kdo2-lipid IVA lauroyltransferase/acyltransferase
LGKYLIFLIVRFFLFILKILPLSISLFIGRTAGSIAYFFNSKQRKLGYSNIKAAYSYKKEPKELKRILKQCYKNLGMMIAEITNFPKLNSEYIRRQIKFIGLEEAEKLKKERKGIIFLTAHLGNWELSAQAVGIKGFPMKVLAREQKHARLNKLLNSYRSSNRCQVIAKGFSIKKIMRSLRQGEILGMLGDQGTSKGGILVDFLGRKINIPEGPALIAHKTKSFILPSFIIREADHKHSIYVSEPLKDAGGEYSRNLIQEQLQKFHNQLSDYIDKNPEQWLWMQERLKYTPARSVLILNDKKAGHLNQSMAVARILKKELSRKGLFVQSPYAKEEGFKIVDVEFKSKLSRNLLNLSRLCAGSVCQGCLKCLKVFLKEQSYRELRAQYADYIISCGSTTAGINLILTKENKAKSIVIMKPPLKVSFFDLAIIPDHDRPKKYKNVIITDGAPSAFDKERIEEDKKTLEKKIDLTGRLKVGLFFGGNNPSYKYQDSQVYSMLKQLKELAETMDAEILATTSRRTGAKFEAIFKQQLDGYDRCKFLVLASSSNPAYASGGILGLSDIIITSFDSISMISEAANSNNQTLVIIPDDYSSGNSSQKHRHLISNFSKKGYIHTASFSNIKDKIKEICRLKPEIKVLNDEKKIAEGLRKII